MDNLSKFYVEVSRTQDGDAKVWLHGQAKQESDGINYISFLLIGSEWSDLFSKGGTYQDGYHMLQAFGEAWTFIDLDCIPRAQSGLASLRYLKLTMPRDIRAYISAEVTEALAYYDASEPGKYDIRETIKLDYTGNLPRWATDYGQGTGMVEVNAEPETMALIGRYSADAKFAQCWERIQNFARNTTHKKSDAASVRIYAEWREDGQATAFSWSAGSLNGGLINHGKDGAQDWGLHT